LQTLQQLKRQDFVEWTGSGSGGYIQTRKQLSCPLTIFQRLIQVRGKCGISISKSIETNKETFSGMMYLKS
jgi:hypothetical protein